MALSFNQLPLDCAVPGSTTTLDSVGVNAWSTLGGELAQSAPFAAIEVDVFDIEGVDMAWEISENSETDVDK